jgi:hypothetical protein
MKEEHILYKTYLETKWPRSTMLNYRTSLKRPECFIIDTFFGEQ